MRAVSILTGPSTHLDHLGTLSALLEVPLIVTDADALKTAQTFYPDLQVELKDLESLSLSYLAENCDVIFESGKFFSTELKPFLKLLFNKTMRFVFCPHGNSDKGHSLKNHVEQDISLVYGDHLNDLLHTSGAREKIHHIVRGMFVCSKEIPFIIRCRGFGSPIFMPIGSSSIITVQCNQNSHGRRCGQKCRSTMGKKRQRHTHNGKNSNHHCHIDCKFYIE